MQGAHLYLIIATALVRVFANGSTNMEKLLLVHFKQLRTFSICSSKVLFVKLTVSVHQQLPSQKEILRGRRKCAFLDCMAMTSNHNQMSQDISIKRTPQWSLKLFFLEELTLGEDLRKVTRCLILT